MVTAALDLAVRAAVVLALAWMVVALLRKQSAAQRALIWTMALGSLLALPVLAWLMPQWRIALWQEPVTVQVVTVRSGEPAPAFPVSISPDRAPRQPVSQMYVPDADTSSAVVPAAPQAVDLGALALLISALVTVVLLVRLAASHLRISRLLARTAPADEAWIVLIDEVRAARGLTRSVMPRISAAVNVPAMTGIFRPTLLLPGESAEWDDDLRRAVIVHELAHVARWDALAQLLGQLACAVYWFIPLAWHGARRAAALRERASDDEVIRAGMPAAAYAGRLLDLVRAAGAPSHQLATLAMARPSLMRERVTALLDPVARREALTMRTIVAAVALSSCAVAAIAAAAPSPSETLILNPAAMTAPEPARLPGARAAASAAVMPATASTAVSEAAGAPIAAVVEQTRRVGARLGPCDANAQTRQHLVGTVNGRRTLRINMEGGGCRIDLDAEGRITFSDDFTDIASLEDRGFFRLRVDDNGTRRELDIESRDGRMTRKWRVDGRELPYDEAARRWFASFLIDLDRRSAIGVDVRLPYLMHQGGVSAVLAETGQMSSDHARGVYYKALNDTARLSPADVTRILQQAAQMTESDHYAHEVIRLMAPHGIGDAAQRAAVTGLIGSMDSDHYIAASVEELVATGRPAAGEMDLLVRVLGRMKSDHYKTQVLTTVLRGATLSADQQAQLAKAAAVIDSDHYASEFLRAVLRARGAGAEVRRTALDSALTIQSDHYRTGTLSVLLENADVSEAELLRVIELAKPMSDHYEAETLRKVLRHRAATDRVREAAIAAGEQMSRHYRDEVLRVAGRAR